MTASTRQEKIAEAPIDAVERFLEAYWRGDHEKTLAYVTDDFVWENIAMPNSEHRGRDALRAVLYEQNMGFPEPIEEGLHETHRFMSEGNAVMHERTDKFKVRGRWMDMPCCAVFEVADGRVALWRDYYDVGNFIRQMESVGIAIDTSQWW